jgi:hypothetical protein
MARTVQGAAVVDEVSGTLLSVVVSVAAVVDDVDGAGSGVAGGWGTVVPAGTTANVNDSPFSPNWMPGKPKVCVRPRSAAAPGAHEVTESSPG